MSNQNFKILIVDDDKNLSLNFIDIFEDKGYYTVVANDGVTAVKLCKQEKFDLALIDIKLPDISGMKLVESIAAISYDTKYIIMTGYASLDSAIEAVKRENIVAYETKPVKIETILAFIRQIYEHKQTQETLRQSYINMELQIQERTAELAEVNFKLQIESDEKQKVVEKEKELNLLKSRFISVISHEFRTPLTGIQSSVQLMELYGHKWDDTKKKDVLTDIYQSIRYINILLDDVSLIGKDESGWLSFNASLLKIENICLQSVKDVKATYNGTASINFDIIPETISAIVDESLLRHILNNLLSNSVKYSVPGSNVDLTTRIISGNIVFTISDSGIGISEIDMKHIFDAFYRASNVETIKGTGLGLAIVKRCIELHGGTIKIKSKLNVGTTVTIRIPYIEEKSDIALN